MSREGGTFRRAARWASRVLHKEPPAPKKTAWKETRITPRRAQSPRYLHRGGQGRRFDYERSRKRRQMAKESRRKNR